MQVPVQHGPALPVVGVGRRRRRRLEGVVAVREPEAPLVRPLEGDLPDRHHDRSLGLVGRRGHAGEVRAPIGLVDPVPTLGRSHVVHGPDERRVPDRVARLDVVIDRHLPRNRVPRRIVDQPLVRHVLGDLVARDLTAVDRGPVGPVRPEDVPVLAHQAVGVQAQHGAVSSLDDLGVPVGDPIALAVVDPEVRRQVRFHVFTRREREHHRRVLDGRVRADRRRVRVRRVVVVHEPRREQQDGKPDEWHENQDCHHREHEETLRGNHAL